MIRVSIVVCLALCGCSEGVESEEKDATPATGNAAWDADSGELCDGSLRTKSELNAYKTELLTVEESLGVACRSPYARKRRWHLCRGVSPEALPRIVEILGDREQIEIWPSAVEAVAYIGSDAEALLLEKLLVRNYAVPWKQEEEDAFEAAFLSLGLMARRSRSATHCGCFLPGRLLA